jgi:predicted unusual protein kinase regulating ubiquinone biosynthesis (AarF/ABC1/UbiB family)
LRIPQPISSYCTRSVLTMERVHGHKITALSPAANVGLDGARLAEELVQAYLKQVLVDGLFHADPHPGNVFLTDEGKLALLDLGMVGHTSPEMQENLLKLLLAISDGKSEHAADVVIGISEKTNDFDPIEFRRRIAHLLAARQEQSLAQMNVGRSLLEVSKNAINNGLVVASVLTQVDRPRARTVVQSERVDSPKRREDRRAAHDEGQRARQPLHVADGDESILARTAGAHRKDPRVGRGE